MTQDNEPDTPEPYYVTSIEPETLGPFDVVAIDGFDKFGIPLGEFNASCGCKFKGRSLLESCEEHKWISEFSRLTSLSTLEDTAVKAEMPQINKSIGEMLKLAYPPDRRTI